MLEWFSGLIEKFGNYLKLVLPTSPFAPYIEKIGELPYLSWLNWFIPVRACLIIFSAWLTAVALFYLYSIILRWVKAIGD